MRTWRYTPPELIEVILAQVKFGERMAVKYSNRAIAARLGLSWRTISGILAKHRASLGLPSGQAFKRKRGRLKKKGSVWIGAL